MQEPKITIVGAGPGDPEMLTLKAIRSLEQANVVMYDALVTREILEYAPEDAVLVYVGKRKGKCVYPQDELNRLIVQYAFYYGHVVRLKGGDPFVFGRGSEEVDYAISYGIPAQVVPGISSSVGVPASVGIPVTRRGVAESFWVLTATTKNHELSKDIALAAKSTATLVILMGVHKLNQIAAILQQEGRGDTPIAVIQHGTTQGQKLGLGTAKNIEAVVAEKGLESPSIIVVGEVVKESAQLRRLYEELKTQEFQLGENTKQAI